MYEERFYRGQILSKFKLEVSFNESDLLVCTDKKIDKCFVESILKKYYDQIKEYVKENPIFMNSLFPLDDNISSPDIIKKMMESSRVSGIGPFSSVAGAIAFYVGNEILEICDEVIIENGGDIFLKINEDKHLGIYLGERFKIKNVILRIRKKNCSFGIASSSAVIGHSLNFGNADVVTVIAKDVVIADGLATSLSNKIKKENDIKMIIEQAKSIPELNGIFIAFDDKMFLWGDLEMAD